MTQEGLDKAFNPEKSSYSSSDKDNSSGNYQYEPKPEDYVRIVNFAEEIKNKANYNGMDICFIVDATGSMGTYIKGAIECIRNVIKDAQKSLEKIGGKEESLRFSIVAYRDHPPQDNTWVTNVCDFTDSIHADKFLSTIQASGGGDAPEAVLDGLNEGINNVKWAKDSEKFMFLLLDAPPHGERFNKQGGDGFPKGCPCGYSEVELLPKLRDMGIELTIVKIGNAIDEMIKIFSQYCNIDVFQPSIFSSGNSYGGGYEEKVKEVMTTNFTYKINSNIEAYKGETKV